METIDAVVAGVLLGSTGGVLIARTVREWHRFRLQERTLRLIAEGVRILEERKEPAHTKPDETV